MYNYYMYQYKIVTLFDEINYKLYTENSLLNAYTMCNYRSLNATKLELLLFLC